MEVSVEINQTLQSVPTLGGTPGTAGEAFEIVADHGVAVIERKERIKATALKLTLAYDATPPALRCHMPRLWKKLFNFGRIVRTLVGRDDGTGKDTGLKIGENSV